MLSGAVPLITRRKPKDEDDLMERSGNQQAPGPRKPALAICYLRLTLDDVSQERRADQVGEMFEMSELSKTARQPSVLAAATAKLGRQVKLCAAVRGSGGRKEPCTGATAGLEETYFVTARPTEPRSAPRCQLSELS